jgi:quercetin dioxygenase-like cupin family protein
MTAKPKQVEIYSTDDQPEQVEIYSTDDLYVRQITCKAGMIIPQHSHVWDHLTMVACGSVFCWKDDEFIGRFVAPRAIKIEAGAKHKFAILEDNTVLYCIHNLRGEKLVQVLEEHNLLVSN